MRVLINVHRVHPYSCANQMRKPRNRLPRAHCPFRDVCGNRLDLTKNNQRREPDAGAPRINADCEGWRRL